MNSVSFKKNLLGVQEELLRFAYKLTADREEANDLLQETSLKALDNEDKYIPDTNFKGWMYTIMRNIFINNYRKIVRDQTFVDHTDNLYHLSMPQDSGFDSTFSEAGRADFGRVDVHCRTHALACNLHQPEFAERQNIMPCPVFLHIGTHSFIKLLTVFGFIHIDEVHDDDTTHIS